jgi:PAS domain-containing protein
MYRFLADNAMDLITRHSADGRIRFASPSALALLAVHRMRLSAWRLRRWFIPTT